VAAIAWLLYLTLRAVERSGLRRRLHRLSERRKFALELRISLVIVFAPAAVAVRSHVSVMLAGFALAWSPRASVSRGAWPGNCSP
jgi:hypothetical protein